MEDKTKKEKISKERATNYESKLSIDLTFQQMVKVVVGKTDEVKKEKGLK